MTAQEDVKKLGYVNQPIDKNIDLKAEILRLKKEKNAVILGHFYLTPELQDISDYVGDSLQLAQKAAKTDAEIIVFLGVNFMGETAKIICPDKKVIIPDLNAGCSLADSCPADEFAKFIAEHPGYTVVSYINTTAAIKSMTDITVTSSNAKQIVDSLPQDEKIIFGPDRNLGGYINAKTGRNMLLWKGACHVHSRFDLQAILKLKAENPNAKVIAHPECEKAIADISDFVASTAGLLKFVKNDEAKDFIVVTEPGILHQMQMAVPEKNYIPAPAQNSTCAHNECNYMKLNTLEKLYNCLKYEMPEINISEEIREKAYRPIKRMLDLSAKLGL